MRSRTAKALHRLGGKPLVAYPVALARGLGAEGIVVVVGRDGERVRAVLGEAPDLVFVEQKEQRGTAHALLQARGAVPDADALLVLSGDVPLLARETVEALLAHHRKTRAAATLLTAVLDDPRSYGRIVRRRGRLTRIVEERDATRTQRRLREVNGGVYGFAPKALWPALDRVTPDNDQGEYYLTDIVGILVRGRGRVETVAVADPVEILGVNDRRQLADLEALLRRRTLARLMAEGVTILDPGATWIEPDVRIGPDTVVYPGVVIEGETVIGERCVVGAGCHIQGSRLGEGVTLRPYCVIADSTIEAGATLGPFAHLRPESVIRAGAKIGNFVELKKTVVGRGSKVPHLSYLGDAAVGEGANIGAGTITCNYDGVAKHPTVIEDRAFVGTNASLVAPLRIGADSYIGAGSTITKDVPPGSLAVGRARQVVKEGWALRRRRRATEPEGEGGGRE
ncbi:MAG: bifunctional UDP-N-acetylglucosamine diphosphorylase/glucosamine-1-phosphate N-acetyltransferase GlmU [Candidatus Rokubacteria bacterium]|nr:bifunctional UDP-N-acetylglucosamine diphosphorylase/glucosamine-1-phosphate N-acetyltransferase GlmU [Candidatus Rokubacteria bacterium]MBI2879624.1 bifunctional UDP-N-acetylglucosamine diphosphorylase/glucosamine-1-phosphate N-acetyltransferase GlmU [Candidatus Rokubacteria bacterium]